MTALNGLRSLTFTFDYFLWDADRQEIGIVYTADINGKASRAVEIMRFGTNGLIERGEALYGAAL